MRIVFLGTPEFAVPSLKILVENGYDIVGVVTAPDKPKGRGKKLGESEVKLYAQEKGLNILQPTNLKDPEFLDDLSSLKADLQIVVAFRMLPESVWNMPPLGTFNLHGSLLPQYRGAAPINWAIINGETRTGVTTFMLRHEIDTGNIILQKEEPIAPDDDAGSVYVRLMHLGAQSVLETVQLLENGLVQTLPQADSDSLKPAPKIFKETCEINWHQSRNQIRNFVRGLSPYPGAWTTLHDKLLKVFKCELLESKTLPAGSFYSDGKSFLHAGTSNGDLAILDLQYEGKRRMSTEEFLRGYDFFAKQKETA